MPSYFKEDRAGKAAFEAKANALIYARMEAACSYAEGQVKQKLSQGGTGRIYKGAKYGKEHRASAPGEPPTVLSGNLRANITHHVLKVGKDFIGIVSSPTDYAPALEFGTRNIAPRPFMRTALNTALPVIWRIIRGGK